MSGGQTSPARPRLIVARGTPHDIGAQIGAATRNEIHATLEHYARRFSTEARLSQDEHRRWGETFLRIAGEYSATVRDQLIGLAEGAGAEPYAIAALNARTEILYGTGYHDDGCTTAGIMPQRTANGSTYLLQNWDWRVALKETTFVIATEDTTGHRVISLTEAGMMAKSGLNSAGIGVCANLLASEADRAGSGVPYHYLLRGALESTILSRAMTAILDTERVASGNIVLGSGEGEVIDLEVAPGTFGRVLPERGILTHSNHFQSAIGYRDVFAPRSALTLIRDTRMHRLLDGAAELLTEEHMAGALRDHLSFPESICRHADTGAAPDIAVSTLYSVVMDLTRRVFAIAPENACQHGYTAWQLDRVFDDPEPETILIPRTRAEEAVTL